MSKSAQPAPLTPRDMSHAMRSAAAATARRDRLLRVGGAVVVAVVVVAILTVGLLAGRGGGTGGPAGEVNPDAAVPTGVQAGDFGVRYGTGWTSPREQTLPTLAIYEDFQCPGCAAFETSMGASVQDLADRGKVKLVYYPATFLDATLPQSNNSSARAAAAWGCAIDAGKTAEYHNALFASQPATEGVGFTNDDLIALAGQVGITGPELEVFTTCVHEGRYLDWAANTNVKFHESGATATPAGVLNGVPLSTEQLTDEDTLNALISGATAH